MTDQEGNALCDTLESIRQKLRQDREYALAAYCIEMAQLEIALLLAEQDDVRFDAQCAYPQAWEVQSRAR